MLLGFSGLPHLHVQGDNIYGHSQQGRNVGLGATEVPVYELFDVGTRFRPQRHLTKDGRMSKKSESWRKH